MNLPLLPVIVSSYCVPPNLVFPIFPLLTNIIYLPDAHLHEFISDSYFFPNICMNLSVIQIFFPAELYLHGFICDSEFFRKLSGILHTFSNRRIIMCLHVDTQVKKMRHLDHNLFRCIDWSTLLFIYVGRNKKKKREFEDLSGEEADDEHETDEEEDSQREDESSSDEEWDGQEYVDEQSEEESIESDHGGNY